MGDTKRKMLTPEQRVAKLEAELAEARKRAEVKANSRALVLQGQLDKLLSQIAERTVKVEAIEAELSELGHAPQPVAVDVPLQAVGD